MRWIILLLGLGGVLCAEPAKVETKTAIGRAFVRLYNWDFKGTHAIVDEHAREDPGDPMVPSVRAAAYMFSELHRLKILELDFFADNTHVIDRKTLVPDPALKAAFFRSVEDAKKLAQARLAAHPGDRESLFALCMVTGLVTDYAALVERRRFGSFSLSRQNQVWARQLLALDPPYYDAYLTYGALEYVVGSMPFFLRWLVRFEQVEGSKEKAIENLEKVASRGKYYGPFARILLSVIHMREKRPWKAESLLAGLAQDFPENPLLREQLARAVAMTHRQGSGH
ncbi:MAG TPA: hypothetical protein VN442_21685 [Bryobacteraceae bacterium]|nr:hypothetical protein [Bryobacteraceae bacterium]